MIIFRKLSQLHSQVFHDARLIQCQQISYVNESQSIQLNQAGRNYRNKPYHFSELGRGVIGSLDSDDINLLKPKITAAMYKNQIERLKPSAVGALTSQHLQKWDHYKLGALSNKKLKAIDPKELAGLKPAILEELNEYKGGVEFTDSQKEMLSEQQLLALGLEPTNFL